MMSKPKGHFMEIEFCIEDVKAARAAQKFRADRIELCSNLAEDGLSPSVDLIKKCREVFSGGLFVMIRPRAGDFIYSDDEVNQMAKEIALAAELGADGVVFGILTDSLDIDLKKNKQLIEVAKKYNLSVTFHRAFDVCNDPLKSLDCTQKKTRLSRRGFLMLQRIGMKGL